MPFATTDVSSTSKNDVHWTDAVREETLLEQLLATCNQLFDDHKGRLNNISNNLRVYEDAEAGVNDNLMNCRLTQLGNDAYENSDGHGYNVIRVCVNTLANKIGKNKVNPRVMVTGAPFAVREKAKKADRFLKSTFKQLKIREHAKLALYDSCLHGTGILKVCNDGKDVWVERVMPDEVFVEANDGYRGNPNRMYEIRYISRMEAIKLTDDVNKQRDIMEATSIPFDSVSSQQLLSESISRRHQRDENIMVIEAWSRNYGDKKGRHSICVSNAVLLDEEFDRDYLPFIKIDYNKPLIGFYATGIAHELKYAQRDLVEMDTLINDSIIAMTAPKILVNGQAEVTTEEFDNIPGSIIRIGGVAPGVALQTVVAPLSPQAISGEVYNYRTSKIQDAHDQTGVSQLAASGQKPGGLDSGVALREYNDIQTERFVLLGQAWEEAHKDIADLLFREMLINGTATVREKRGSSIKAMKISDLGLSLDSIEVGVYPVSQLPSTPSGRLQTVNEWIQAGLITPVDAAELLDMPDLETFNELNGAPKRAVDKLISRIMENPFRPFVINPYLDLNYLIDRCRLHYNYVLAEMDDDIFDDYMGESNVSDEINEMLDLDFDPMDDDIIQEDEVLEEEEELNIRNATETQIAEQLLNTFIRIVDECKALLAEEAAEIQGAMGEPPMEAGGAVPPEMMSQMSPEMGGEQLPPELMAQMPPLM
jgi:hypothetical protein